MKTITKLLLHELFTLNEEALGTYSADYESGILREHYKDDPKYYWNAIFLPDGRRMINSTNNSMYVCKTLGEGDIYGFGFVDNPVELKSIRIVRTHDFAVIRSRYIVDPWVSLYTGDSKQGVFDLHDPEDHASIKHIYGDPEKWGYLRLDKLDYPIDWMPSRECYVFERDPGYPRNKAIRITDCLHEACSPMQLS